jgi:hypothetical protein
VRYPSNGVSLRATYALSEFIDFLCRNEDVVREKMNELRLPDFGIKGAGATDMGQVEEFDVARICHPKR